MSLAHAAADDWRDLAACHGEPTSLFYPLRGDHSDLRQARAICARCPVKAACLEEGLHLPRLLDIGVWGGTTPKERRRIRKGRR